MRLFLLRPVEILNINTQLSAILIPIPYEQFDMGRYVSECSIVYFALVLKCHQVLFSLMPSTIHIAHPICNTTILCIHTI
jgi:hypothetical protein